MMNSKNNWTESLYYEYQDKKIIGLEDLTGSFIDEETGAYLFVKNGYLHNPEDDPDVCAVDLESGYETWKEGKLHGSFAVVARRADREIVEDWDNGRLQSKTIKIYDKDYKVIEHYREAWDHQTFIKRIELI